MDWLGVALHKTELPTTTCVGVTKPTPGTARVSASVVVAYGNDHNCDPLAAARNAQHV